MRAKVAVATVQGKAYFLILCELKRRNILFISLIPGQVVPVEIRVVITTPKEKPLVNHAKVLTYDAQTDPEVLGNQLVKVLKGKERYETVTVGVDPGDVFGVAVIADGSVIDEDNCFSVKETVDRIQHILKIVDAASTAVTVKVGNGVPIHRELLESLDWVVPPEVVLEVVSEAGTNHYEHEAKHRQLRHIYSAIHIAARRGYAYPRVRTVEQES